MNIIQMLKGVIQKMLPNKTIEEVLQLKPTISSVMKNNIELWEQMYMDQSPWITENIKSANIASLIASEKARTATIEMDIKITGDNERAKFIRDNFKKVTDKIREQLEYGVALGGLVIKPYITIGAENKYVMQFNYTKATEFYPLSFTSEGDLSQAAFIDRVVTKDVIYSKVEYHSLVSTNVVIRNYAFSLKSDTVPNGFNDTNLGEPIPLSSVPDWAQLAPEAVIKGAGKLMFSYFKMPEANTVDKNSPLGVSGFSRAVDLIKHADELYSDLLWEFEGGQLALDVDRTALNPLKDKDGKETYVLPKLQDRLYRRNLDLGLDNMYNVFSPQLRDASIINGLNNQLMRIEDACALSRGTLSIITNSEARTATELKILKQRSYSANQDIQKELQRTFEEVIDIMDKYCDLYEITPAGKFDVAYKWDDSIIVDKDAERQQDLLEVQAGLMSKLEYRMKWYGETEDQALLSLQVISDEHKEAIKQQLEMQNQLQVNNTNISEKSDAQASHDKKVRANESNKIIKNSSDK